VPFGALLSILGVLSGGLSYGILEGKTRINQGIVLSARNSVLAGVAMGVLLGTFVFLFLFFLVDILKLAPPPEIIVQSTEQLVVASVQVSLLVMLFGGLIAFLRFGGMDVLQHAALRLVLWRSGDAPLDYPRFLDHAAKLIFLQKVGGGYIFMHRLLLEHFASLEN
jgi:hypothetical protein